jgi:hypothetical protein
VHRHILRRSNAEATLVALDSKNWRGGRVRKMTTARPVSERPGQMSITIDFAASMV